MTEKEKQRRIGQIIFACKMIKEEMNSETPAARFTKQDIKECSIVNRVDTIFKEKHLRTVA